MRDLRRTAVRHETATPDAANQKAAAGGMPAAAGIAFEVYGYRAASSARPCSYAASRDTLSASS
jgi:hypothetical protein